MNFRDEILALRFAAPTEDMLDEVFDKHVETWHYATAPGHIWTYLGLSLEEYSDLILKGDGLQTFFQTVCRED